MIARAVECSASLTLLLGSALQPKGAAVHSASSSGVPGAHVGWSITSCQSVFGISHDVISIPASGLGRQRRNQPCRIVCSTVVEEKEELEAGAVEKHDEPSTSAIPAPGPFEVQSLLMQLCDETSIAEVNLKMGGFQLHVLRDVTNLGRSRNTVSDARIAAPHVPGKPMVEAMTTPALANGKALAVSAPPAQTRRASDTEDDDEVDEGLLHVVSPKVGVFRRGRFVKGKKGRPMVVEGQMIKHKQIIGYIQQLGTQQPIESEHAGEVVRFPVEDGEPVGYGERLVEIRPSFPGIKKLSS
ncbi:hypothetical protein CBR_g45314 [Chara braunii]|uniref:Lipoyl-binding domain-containing protein n=1 Tax=Chara braunii TaxID=69332 RepID=A0A388LYA8_CHABU|nr:hypothetical protein CBR_g45314 [Chara braunii]|eukprot:GBG87255.1 hypothetical protein CBR_g45314 [Chara braunii]